MTSADENFEIVATGAAVALLSQGSAVVYDRPGIVCVPVSDLGPAELAVGWRRGDSRSVVRSFVDACIDAAQALQLSCEHLPGPQRTPDGVAAQADRRLGTRCRGKGL